MKAWILAIALCLCGVVVEAQPKVLLKKSNNLCKKITTENRIYVLKYDFILNKDLIVPANSILELDGGRILGNYNIYLGENCRIIGHGSEEVNIGGTIYLNYGSFIGNVNLVRSTVFNNAEGSFVKISDEYIKHPFYGSANTSIVIENVNILYPINTHHDFGNAVEIISGNGNLEDNSFRKGMYNFTFSKVNVNGYFNRAFYVHALSDGWITSLTFDKCFIERCTYGWKIDSFSTSAIEQVNITNCGIQNYDWSQYAVDCGKAELYIKHLRTWDWWNNKNVGSPYRFTEETRKTFIDVLFETRQYDIDSDGNQFNNNIHIENWTYDRDIEKIIDLRSGFIKLITLYTLPNGTYRIPQDRVAINALGIDARVLGGTMIVSGGINEKLIVFVSNYLSNNKIVALLSFDREPSKSESVNYNTWTYSLTSPSISGKTSERPKYTNETWSYGRYYFDMDLGKPIWWNGSYWVDAFGKRVSN